MVAPAAGTATFHRVSNPAESGLLPAQSLQKLWPHLGAEQDALIEDATTLDALYAEAGGQINWLVLDCLPAAALLQGGAKLLPQLDVALVRVASDLSPELLADQQAVDQVLHAVGLRCIHGQAERHPALAHVLYVRDTAHRLKAAEQAYQAASESARQAADQAKQASEQAQKALQEQLRQAQEQLKSAQEAWAKEKADLMEAHQEASRSARQAEDQAKQVSEQAQKALREQLQQAQSKQLEACQQSINDVEKQLRASFDKSLANSVKQIEDFISIQNYLSNGDSLSNFHGWPISPDIGLFLIEHIRERRHDLIIEFGSGTSTALFARTLKISRPEALPRAAKASKGVKSLPVRAPRPVCTFEHDKLYLNKTKAMLETQGLLEWVALNHAPLVDWQDDTGHYLHYDCDATLATLAKQLGAPPKRVLVLVDGPPGSTCPNARYPAVPLVFKYFARHEVDVVLDDASRPEEKAVIELWRTYWKKRSIRAIATSKPSEKGLYWARNYD
ncbi:hypothetical protein CSC70_12535 [Pseudoxanthomonas kalamensis DSM 18571]|nr:hypothetical protein CSC70_12535 [Pseudoxanthomonas kalamensis DSM 18571]